MKPFLFSLLLGLLMNVPAQSLEKPTVITSIHPLYALTQEVAGDNAEVIRLLPPGASPHTFDPTPKDVAALAEADLVVLNGGLDEWVLDLVDASGARAPVLNVLPSIEFEPLEDAHNDNHSEDDSAEETGEEHDHSSVNPHIWLEPTLMIKTVPLIAQRLAEIDPEHAETYRTNGEEVVAELTALDEELKEVMEPLQNAAFVPFHDAWPYFARHFGLDLVVEIEPAPGREPSPAYVAEALSQIEESGAKAIFSEVQLPARPAEVVAESAGVPLYILDPLGGTQGVETYAELMRTNVNTVLEALSSN